MKRNRRLATLGGGALLVAVSLTFGSQDVTAADHDDSPAAMADKAVDLADYYAWVTGDGNVVLAMTFGGPIMGNEPVYDADALYTFHIDTDGDGTSDQQIYARFGQNLNGDWGVQFEGVPGAAAAFSTAVDTPITDGSAQGQAGIFDDPFFFDLLGFQATMMALGNDDNPVDLLFASVLPKWESLDNDFAPAVDTNGGANAMGIVIEFPLTDLGVDNFFTWASASRIEDAGGSSGGSSGSGSSGG